MEGHSELFHCYLVYGVLKVCIVLAIADLKILWPLRNL